MKLPAVLESNMEWSKGQVIALISLYKKHTCLWEVTSEDYKNRALRREAWNEIAAAMGMKSNQVEKRMRSILIVYRREKKKIRKCIDGTSDFKASKWFCFPQLQFLEGFNEPISPNDSCTITCTPDLGEVGNTSLEVESDNSFGTLSAQNVSPGTSYQTSSPKIQPLSKRIKMAIQEERFNKSSDFVNLGEIGNTFLEVESDNLFGTLSAQNVSPPTSYRTSSPKIQPLPKRIKMSIQEERFNKSSDFVESVLHHQKIRDSKDEYSAFGDVVAIKIRNLKTPTLRSSVQYKIYTLLYEAELEDAKVTVPATVESEDAKVIVPTTVESARDSKDATTIHPLYESNGNLLLDHAK